MQEVISWTEAKARELSHYFTGRPCKIGHVVELFGTVSVADNTNVVGGGERLIQKGNTSTPVVGFLSTRNLVPGQL